MLTGHAVSTVPKCGWSGIKNGKLLALAGSAFDVFLTADQNIEFQQNLASLPLSILVVAAESTRMEHLAPLVPEILRTLNHLAPRTLRKVSA